MRLEFSGKIFSWRGPAPYYFVTIPTKHSRNIQVIASLVTYGWGVIPVTARIGDTQWTTSLFPKNDGYLVPIKDVVRRAEGLALGDAPTVALTIEA